MKEQERIKFYWNLGKEAKTDKEKTNFFDKNEEAFYLDSEERDEFQNAKLSYCAERNFSDEETDDFDQLSWSSFPSDFKLYAFEYCILDGVSYSDVQNNINLENLVSLISLDKVIERLENQGLSLSEVEEEILILLEKELRKLGKSATEDDLYDATKVISVEFINYLDDNHPDNIAA